MNEKTNGQTSFEALGISENLTEKLSALNITAPTEIQQKTIPLLLEKKNVIFESETGTGKTFAYLLPLIQNTLLADDDGKIIILAPTYELSSQIKAAASSLAQFKTALFIGGVPIKRQIEQLKEKPRVIVGNPSRILELILLKKIKPAGIKALVLDEADRLTSTEIIEETKKLVSLFPQNIQFAACSATLNARTKKTLSEFFSPLAEVSVQNENILSKRITHYAIFAEARDKIPTLKSFLLAEKPEKALIFTSRADQVENIASKLRFKKIECESLHAKSDKQSRKAAVDRFKSGKCRFLVTSDLASRGLDIPGISHIIQMDLPSNEDFFIHRAGRTARAGKSGINVVIGDEYEMRKYAALEKRFALTVFPKMIYKGKLVSPSDI